jgi:hypothetical protein
VFTQGFVFLVGSVLPFPRTCVHSGFCFLGGGLSYPSRGTVLAPGFVVLLGSLLPFPRNCARSKFCFLGGVCLTLPEELCSLQVLFSWWGLSYPSRGSVFTPGFVFLVGSVLPFPKTCTHSRFCLLGGVCLTLPEDLCSLQVLFSPHQENKTWSEHRSSRRVSS